MNHKTSTAIRNDVMKKVQSIYPPEFIEELPRLKRRPTSVKDITRQNNGFLILTDDFNELPDSNSYNQFTTSNYCLELNQ